MSAADGAVERPVLTAPEESRALNDQWRALRRSATFVALISAPAAFLWLWQHTGLSFGWAIVATAFAAFAFRGALDLVFRKFIPWPSLFATEDLHLREEDVLNRRRAWFWHQKARIVVWLLAVITFVWLWRVVIQGRSSTWWGTADGILSAIGHLFSTPQLWIQVVFVFFLFLANFLIFMGPLMLMGISQIRGFEPGDANWGVKLDDVRGQAEAKEEVRRIVNLWQSGEAFEKAGGRRERGLLFHGAPGTGKTMLAKAIATGFNSPFVSIPGSGFAQAQPLEAKILTPRGWTTMGAIQIGDEVIDPEGGTARVIGVFPQGERDIYRVTFSDGSSTECDLDHLWQVRRHGNRPWRVEMLRSIKEKLESDSRQNRPYIPLVQNLEFEEEELPLDPYLLGLLLGDGYFSTTPSLITAEPELVGASAAHLPSGMWAEEGKPGAYYLTAGKRGRLPNPLPSQLKSLGLYGHGALTKFVPDMYKYARFGTRLELLRGLMDTDGYVRQDERSEAVFATSCSALADDLVFLVRSLGGTATKRATGKGTYRHPVHGDRPAAPAWHVQVALGPDCNPFRLERKRDSWNRVWEPSRRIVSIEKVGRKQAQCIKLDSQNELYVTDDFIVTHNTFIGIDALIVRWLARKAKRLASKWGGQCIVFIDEIDAVGMRRASLGAPGGPSMTGAGTQRFEDYCFYGPYGALNPTGDLILETRGWRDRLFVERDPPRPSPYPGWVHRLSAIVNQAFPGGMFGGMGQLALNQLLVTMDGIDNPPFWRRFWTNRINTWLDASYVVPRRIGKIPLRMAPPRPSGNQIYFIGATNVPLEHLDPALRRPGRMGRHVWFRTPTKKDREDIFHLYLDRVSHDPELDAPPARDELARITNGYAQPLDAGLLTPTGWKRLGDVQVGDLLIGSDGQPTAVRAVHPRGEMEVFKVTFNDGTSTECTADHLWSVEANDPRMLTRTLTLGEIVHRGLRWSPSGSRFYVPKLASVQFEAPAELPLDAYFLGLLLGDGGFTSTTPDFCSADEESIVAVAALAPAGVTLKQHGPMNWWLSSGPRGGRQRGRVNPLTAALGELDPWGVSGHHKFVPDEYKRAAPEDRLSLLQGLMDTDGTRDYRRGNGAIFNSHSCQLAEDVAYLARSLGGSARVRPKREGWRVAVDLPEGMVPFRLPRKAADYRASRRPFRKRIFKVELVGRKEVQCVTVAADNGLYVTDGFTVTHNSPAMIEQVCSMALTRAHHDGRELFTREDIIEAMTTVESGTAIGVEYVPEETRAVAIHEAGHAATAHVFLKGVESTRISIRMRAGSLGHHMALEKEERFSSWKHEEMGKLAWTLGSLAAEHVFYGENATGVGGDLQSATGRAAWMVGVSGMGPDRISLNGNEKKRDELMHRFEKLGLQLMNRASGDFQHDAIAAVLGDPTKRAFAAQIIGQAYVNAYNLVLQNQAAVEQIAEALIERKELYGDELVDLLNSVDLKEPKIDLSKEAAWPTL